MKSSRFIFCLYLLVALSGLVFLGATNLLAAPDAQTRHVGPNGANVLIVGGNPIPNTCVNQAKPCKTIKWAVETVAQNGDTISVTAGTYLEKVNVSKNVTIKGAGVRGTHVDGNASGSVFSIKSGAVVKIKAMRIRNGHATSGGGINVNGGSSLTLQNVTLANNQAGGGGGIANFGTLNTKKVVLYENQGVSNTGGGLYNVGVATLNQTSIQNNHATNGAGIYNVGTLTLTNSAVHGNSTPSGYGGIYNSGGTLTLTNVTISGNSSDSQIFQGGALYQSGGSTTLNYVTMTKNVQGDFGAIYVSSGSVSMENSIIAGNGANPQCGTAIIGPFSDMGYNLVADQTCGYFAGTGTIVANPKLKPLEYNGGFTPTHALKSDSPAIDLVPNNQCIAQDQRGDTRPKDGNADGSWKCDAGAYEYP